MSRSPAAFRQESKEKNKRKAEQAKKRKAEEAERQQAHEGPDFSVADPASTEPASSDYSESPAVTDKLAVHRVADLEGRGCRSKNVWHTAS